MKAGRGLCLACSLYASAALAQPSASDARPELSEALPQGRLIGQARLKVWGFEVYDARLWAPGGFSAGSHATSPLALELVYLRDFRATDIAGRSIKEMRRSQPVSDAQATEWSAAMLRVIPDVRKGDRIMALHRPGSGAAFWVNGKASGEIVDAEFARLFFAIWLSPRTSEPQLRQALLTGAGE